VAAVVLIKITLKAQEVLEVVAQEEDIHLLLLQPQEPQTQEEAEVVVAQVTLQEQQAAPVSSS
jgi:hypothetical protein